RIACRSRLAIAGGDLSLRSPDRAARGTDRRSLCRLVAHRQGYTAMMDTAVFTASGIAIPSDAAKMLDQLCEQLPDYVVRTAMGAKIETAIGGGDIALSDNRLIIKLQCPTASMLFT